MYRRVLVPTDGSEPASAAVQHALGIAQRYGATLHAVFVINTDMSWLSVSRNEVRNALRDVGRATGERVLRDVEGTAVAADVDLVTDVLEGSPDERILEYAVGNDIDLIVMGTHGRSGLEHRFLGTVSERVIRAAGIPVMTVASSEGSGVPSE